MTDQSLAVREAQAITQGARFDADTIDLIRASVSDPRNPLTSDEFSLFIAVCQHLGANPLLREAYALKDRGGRFSVVIGIDKFRQQTQANPRFAGQVGPEWAGKDGQWRNIWTEDEPPVAARVGILMRGSQQPTWGIAYWKSCCKPASPQWQTNGPHMLAIRAEAHAHRKCSSRLGGLVALREDDTGWGEVGDGALDTPSPRGRAIAAQMDAALAEADALLAEPPSSAEALRRSLDYARREGKYAEAASLEEEVAEAEAREQEQAPEETGELPGPRWGTTPLCRQVSALADALLNLPESDPARRFVLPANAATDAEIEQWIASKRRLLAAKRPSR